jgi:hypothetical protein
MQQKLTKKTKLSCRIRAGFKTTFVAFVTFCANSVAPVQPSCTYGSYFGQGVAAETVSKLKSIFIEQYI